MIFVMGTYEKPMFHQIQGTMFDKVKIEEQYLSWVRLAFIDSFLFCFFVLFFSFSLKNAVWLLKCQNTE